MSKNIEIEKTYLASKLPHDFKKFKSKEIIDIYLPKNSQHAKLRIRKSGDSYVITKKYLVNKKTASKQIEENIIIDEAEFKSLEGVNGNKIKKIRYYYYYLDKCFEIDVFLDKLKGLVLVDVEFSSEREMHNFSMPDFCLVDVTEEEMIAGGVLSQHSYSSLSNFLNRFGYKKLRI